MNDDWYMEYSTEEQFDWDEMDLRNATPCDDFFDHDSEEIDFEDF